MGKTSKAGEAGITFPHLIVRKAPMYPEEVRQKSLEARIVMDAIIRKDGSVAVRGQKDCKVSRMKRYPKRKYERFCPQLYESARSAVLEWRYAPATRNGDPVDALFTIVVDFELR
jgi:hypothetical protein